MLFHSLSLTDTNIEQSLASLTAESRGKSINKLVYFLLFSFLLVCIDLLDLMLNIILAGTIICVFITDYIFSCKIEVLKY